jgi:hypothetical protein
MFHGVGLYLMTQFQQPGAIAAQFPGQLGRRDTMGDASQDEQQLGTGTMRPLEDRPGEGVEYPSAGFATIVQDGAAIPTVNRKMVGSASGTSQPVGVKNVQPLGVANVLVHEIHKREVHDRSSLNRP